MSTDTTNRGTCPVCAARIRVTRTGRLAEHTRPDLVVGGWKRCPGSRQLPEGTPPR